MVVVVVVDAFRIGASFAKGLEGGLLLVPLRLSHEWDPFSSLLFC